MLLGLSPSLKRAGSSESDTSTFSPPSISKWGAVRAKASANNVFQAAGRRRTREHKHMLRPVSVVRVTWNLISTVWLVYLLVLV